MLFCTCKYDKSERCTHTAPGFGLQNTSNSASFLRQLNSWFSGEFRSIMDPPLYARNEITVVRAMHKVSTMPVWC